eukprot:7386853-Prymnesium_polylepis.1
MRPPCDRATPCDPMRPHGTACGPTRPHAIPCGPMRFHEATTTRGCSSRCCWRAPTRTSPTCPSSSSTPRCSRRPSPWPTGRSLSTNASRSAAARDGRRRRVTATARESWRRVRAAAARRRVWWRGGALRAMGPYGCTHKASPCRRPVASASARVAQFLWQ